MSRKAFDFLMTGGSGFLGSHLAARLAAMGRTALLALPSEMDLLRRNIPPNVLSRLTVIKGDLTRDADVAALPDARVVYHLAAISYVPPTIANPKLAVDVNFLGTFRLLERYRARMPELFVYISSAHVYGSPRYVPMNELHPMEPTTPYGATKAAADRLVQSYHNCYGMPTVIFRPFNMYGPRQDPRFIIPEIIRQALAGGDVTLGNLKPQRDFTYIGDAVELMIRPMSRPEGIGKAFNVGSGKGVPVGQLASTIIRLAGGTTRGKRRQRVLSDPARFRPGEIPRIVADVSAAKRTFRWSPHTHLQTGLALTIEHYRSANAAGAGKPAGVRGARRRKKR